jgi:hypothetical protein
MVTNSLTPQPVLRSRYVFFVLLYSLIVLVVCIRCLYSLFVFVICIRYCIRCLYSLFVFVVCIRCLYSLFVFVFVLFCFFVKIIIKTRSKQFLPL